ncbi:hypothetical protein F5880DRAFT_1608651 [Lentinula raphanica]|nr:hypothetical protein F5880DRAFT_1608651 [Lentinula raphanica]
MRYSSYPTASYTPMTSTNYTPYPLSGLSALLSSTPSSSLDSNPLPSTPYPHSWHATTSYFPPESRPSTFLRILWDPLAPSYRHLGRPKVELLLLFRVRGPSNKSQDRSNHYIQREQILDFSYGLNLLSASTVELDRPIYFWMAPFTFLYSQDIDSSGEELDLLLSYHVLENMLSSASAPTPALSIRTPVKLVVASTSRVVETRALQKSLAVASAVASSRLGLSPSSLEISIYHRYTYPLWAPLYLLFEERFAEFIRLHPIKFITRVAVVTSGAILGPQAHIFVACNEERLIRSLPLYVRCDGISHLYARYWQI